MLLRTVLSVCEVWESESLVRAGVKKPSSAAPGGLVGARGGANPSTASAQCGARHGHGGATAARARGGRRPGHRPQPRPPPQPHGLVQNPPEPQTMSFGQQLDPQGLPVQHVPETQLWPALQQAEAPHGTCPNGQQPPPGRGVPRQQMPTEQISPCWQHWLPQTMPVRGDGVAGGRAWGLEPEHDGGWGVETDRPQAARWIWNRSQASSKPARVRAGKHSRT
jgi:hypothetical protein